MPDTPPIEPPDEYVESEQRRLRDMVCPQCNQPFELRWRDYERDGSGYKSVRTTLDIRGCPSGGIYDVRISCPHCNYEEEL